LTAAAADLAAAPMTLGLNKAFVNQIKNRATIQISLHVDQHLKTPHSIGRSGDDGDIHMAGRDDKVELPLVVEIMNARLEGESRAVQILNGSSASVPIAVAGVWRIWFEHPVSGGTQIQGESVPVPTNSNPDHVFEVHPVVGFGDQNLIASLVPIVDPKNAKGYEASDAKKAFATYEKLTTTISSTATAITMTSAKVGFNYVEFLLEPVGEVAAADDGGLLLLARVSAEAEPDEPLTASPIRMVFVKDSPPARELAAHPGETLKVLGTPRVDLAQVAEIAQSQNSHDEDSVKLPYEMVIVGVFTEPVEP